MDIHALSYTVYGFMVAEGLRGAELQVYALIYSFSRKEGGCFFGSLQYIADRTGISLRSVHRAVVSLTESGYIEKEGRESSNRAIYRANLPRKIAEALSAGQQKA